MSQRYVAHVDTYKLSPLLQRTWQKLDPNDPDPIESRMPSQSRSAVMVFLLVMALIIAVTGEMSTALVVAAIGIAFGVAKARRVENAKAYSMVGEPKKVPSGARFYGSAGSVGAAAATFGDKAQIGAEGEKRTAQLLELCRGIDGLHVFHGVRFPGSTRADIDHVLVYGKKIMLVDSKLFRSGCEYRLVPGGGGQDPSQKATITSSCGASHVNSMPAAATAYAQRFPSHQVSGAIIVHGRDSSASSPRGYHVSMFTPEEFFAQHLVSWLSSTTPRAHDPALATIRGDLIS